MEAKQIFKKIQIPKGTTITIGGEVIKVGPKATKIIKGKSFNEISRIMRAASKENLFRNHE